MDDTSAILHRSTRDRAPEDTPRTSPELLPTRPGDSILLPSAMTSSSSSSDDGSSRATSSSTIPRSYSTGATPITGGPPPSPFAAFLLPYQHIVFLFPVTLLAGSLFGFIAGDTPSYFSNKRNLLNMVFAKNAWGWTSFVFFVYLALAFGPSVLRADQQLHPRRGSVPPSTTEESLRQEAAEQVAQEDLLDQLIDPAIGEAIGISGGGGVHRRMRERSQPTREELSGLAYLPGQQPPSLLTTPPRRQKVVPADLVIRALLRWTLATAYWWLISQWFFGPGLFDRVFVLTGGKCSVDGHWSSYHCRKQGGLWAGGVDISGHIFLMTHAWLFLMEELSVFLNVPEAWMSLRHHQPARYAVYGVAGVGLLWWWMLLMTSVYFHHMTEKLTGMLFGILFWAGTYVTSYKTIGFPSMPDQNVVF